MAGGAAGATLEPNAFRFAGFWHSNALVVDNLMGPGVIALIAFRRR